MGLRFTPTSFFPNLNLNDILEIEFQLTYNLNIPFEYNHMEYYEFVWLFERLVEERKKESEHNSIENGRISMSNLGLNMDMMSNRSDNG